MTTDTLPIPRQPTTSHLPLAGDYTTGSDRCVVELAGTIGGLTMLRHRLTPVTGHLTVGQDPAESALRVEAGTTAPAGRHRGDRYGAVRFASTGITPVAPDRLAVHCDLSLRDGTVRTSLDARVVRREDDRLLLLGMAWLNYWTVRDVCGFRLPRLVPAEDIRFLIAADFT
jgi:hypothetical protein